MSSLLVSGLPEYAALHARVRVMYSNLLTPQMLDNLCEAPDLPALIRLLADTIYAPYLTGLDETDITPRRLEYQIKRRIASAYELVIRSAPAHTRPLLIHLYRRFEVDNLKAVLRGIGANASWERVQYVLFPFETFPTLPFQALVESGSIEAVVELLRDTPYYDILSHAMSRYTSEQSLFPLEVALDLFYWRELWKLVNQLRGPDHQQARRIVGLLLDMANLMWAIRYREFHHLSEEEIINYTLPFNYRVRDQDIRAIAAGADISQVVMRIYPNLSDLSGLFQDLHSRMSELELDLQRNLARQCQETFVGYPFHIGIPLAYLILCELEIQDLVALIEAKASHKTIAEFHPYLLVGCPPG